VGDKILCKDSSDAEVFKLQCYSGRKILNQYRLVQLIKKSKLVALHTYAQNVRKSMLYLLTFSSVITIVC